jgi:superfamily II DNA or RNA helicase
MNSIELHKKVTQEYKNYIHSFVNIKDDRIREYVNKEFDNEGILPKPLVQFNPSFVRDEKLQDLVDSGMVHPDIPKAFGNYNLYKHQIEAIKIGVKGEGFIVTSGTGSGKSLTFLATIFDYVFKNKQKLSGVTAVLVYPMNALINSQEEEIMKYEINYLNSFLPEIERKKYDPSIEENKSIPVAQLLEAVRSVSSIEFPVRYSKYTGQENDEARERAKNEKPHIILTNYMMLELIMTREKETWMRELMKNDLRYLVFDELHTYRGRQGADVSLLIRRLGSLTENQLVGIGTSATMATKGGILERKQEVAKVGNTIFGQKFTTDQIIGEYLETYTDISKPLLTESIIQDFNSSHDAIELKRNSFCTWLEKNIALEEIEPGFYQRGKPKKVSDIAEQLTKLTNCKYDEANQAIINLLQNLEIINDIGAKQNPRLSFLPFRFHQFISQTSTVHVTLDDPMFRAISLKSGRYIKTDNEDQFVYPVLFSRHSGHEFICVRKNYDYHILEPRDPDDISVHFTKDDLKGDRETGRQKKLLNEQDLIDGYIIFDHEGEDPIWSEDEITELPDSWWKERGVIIQVNNYYEFRLPRKVFFSSKGKFSDTQSDEFDLEAWYIPARLIFDPTAGIVYDLKTKENTKLMRLGNEGRSTATTITSFAVVKELMRQHQPVQVQKLLSFTDNRQDASLQAGHFNDFIATIRLRSAVYHALNNSPKKALRVHDISRAVYNRLRITDSDYAQNPSPDWPDPENQRAEEIYLLLRVLRDLKRGWRYNLPNLEQTALLEIDFERLGEFCAKQDFFIGVPLFESLSSEDREEIIRQILSFFRTSYAIEHRYLDDRAETESFLNTRLDDSKMWSLDKGERIEVPPFLTNRIPGWVQKGIFISSAGPMSYLGKYFKRLFTKHNLTTLTRDEYYEFTDQVFEFLRKGNFLAFREIRGEKQIVLGYRLRTDNMIWKAGSSAETWIDKVRTASYKSLSTKPNSFFRELYETDFTAFEKSIIGSEHTGQLDNPSRIDREERFKSGKISALFCSPTMELGIDIAELNIVHMRNVPPSPANYAQRSGRAGRSGQTAVVFTYCSSRSPHDRNYFKEPISMVAGAVVPPRIDLTNEELLSTHLNAFILMKLAISDLSVSVSSVLDTRDKDVIPIKEDILNYIQDRSKHFPEWSIQFKNTIKDVVPSLSATNWFNDLWLENRAISFLKRFDDSFNRWRILFKNAEGIIVKARSILDDPTIKQYSPQMLEAKRQHNTGMAQRALLLNDSNRAYGNASEFYVFRYLASEGFLPGYNFTRLPVRTFIGYKYKDEGEYISRPRYIALKEFGPNNLIYHNGSKYRINRAMLTDASLRLNRAKVSLETGYIFLNEQAEQANNDPITRSELNKSENVKIWANLLELSECEAIPQERISCEEEERTSTGFEIEQYFSYPKGITSTIKAEIKVAGTPILNLTYCQATQLVQINHKWRRSTDSNGFFIHDTSGKWLKQSDMENAEIASHGKEVRIFTNNTSDTIYMQPVSDLGLNSEQIISLAYALKRGIESVFQAEENEIGIWIMGKSESPNIMIYEASEGSLGIMSLLIHSPSKLKEVYEAAYQLLHFDLISRKDQRPNLPKATYDDLLSYYNQTHHDKLDRHQIQEALEKLIDSELDVLSEHGSRDDLYKYLLSAYDKNSATEYPLIRFLYDKNYALPDKAQVNLESFYINVDFVFNTQNGPVLIFCDGSVHSNEDVKSDDEKKRQHLRDAGYDVIEWFFDERSGANIIESIAELIEERKDVFRKL